MLRRCNVENCEDTSVTMVEKGKILKNGRAYCVAGASNDVSYKNNTFTPVISIYHFPKDVGVWPKWTRFDRRLQGDFTLQCRLLRTGFEDGCYEHITLNKSGTITN